MRRLVLLFALMGCGRGCGRDRATKSEAPNASPPADDMVLVPAGAFLMGDPPHSVEVDVFLIDRNEVTRGDYDRCVAAGACAKIPEHYLEPPPPPRHPVVDVTLTDAEAFCAWLGKQLPTEEQWEKAARGTDGRTYPWGNDPPSCERALYEDWTPDRGTDVCGDITHPKAMHPVGSHPAGASPYGVLDMAGNALEWTSSREGGRWVVRGGRGFGHGVPIITDDLRVTYRQRELSKEARDPVIGFRCVRTPKGRELPAHRD